MQAYIENDKSDVTADKEGILKIDLNWSLQVNIDEMDDF
jgi:hypothetical protein